ncbi:MAG: cobaltochelatase subunit CobN [Bacillota bacterium]
MDDLETYCREAGHLDGLPRLGVLMYGGMHFYDTAPVVDALYEHLRDDVNLVCVFSRVEYNLAALEKYMSGVDLLINLQYFRLHGGPYGGDPEPTYRLLEKMDVPVLTGLRAFETEIMTWEEESRGLSPLEIILGITLPELDGAIEPLFVSAMESFADSHIGKIKRQAVLDERIIKLAQRALAWLNLRKKANREKKIAILTYDYPPGESNLASAGYLDVFTSMEIFLCKLEQGGYNVEIPTAPLHNFFLQHGLVNSPQYGKQAALRIPLTLYREWFEQLPRSVRERITARWGEPPGEIMVEDGELVFPGYLAGNVLLGVQPSRGVHENPEQAYHDRDLPPTHQYLAFYLYLQKVFKADAVIHFGMHGTLEFNRGKEVALSRECFPDLLIGTIPHLYYYWIGNTAESTIAKRRAYALCISHGSPPVKNSGLYESYLVLDDLLDQWEGEGDETVLAQLQELAQELHLCSDPAALRQELYRMKRRLIPDGLYIMDRKWEEPEMAAYLFGALRHDREFPSILKVVAREEGAEWAEIKGTSRGDSVETTARELALDLVRGQFPPWLPQGYGPYVRELLERLQTSREGENLLRALEGRYILPSRGGDPVRDPDVYPAGRAMYAFDPRLIPTVAAQNRGKEAAGKLLAALQAKNGRYPETVALVLWGFETMKTGGDTIAAILDLLGVRLRKKSTWFRELEVIPLAELGRPRIDVMITICGIFRDTFATHLDLLNRAIELVAALPEREDENYVRKHYLQLEPRLGLFAQARIFGPPPEEYATSLTTLVESGAWEQEEELADSFDRSMTYAYLPGKTEQTKEAFHEVMQTVEAIAQERDNTEYEVTDLDHYYEFMGGLSRSLRHKTGREAHIMVIDTTEEEVEVEDLKASIERASRTRLFNPAWLEGMLKHDFHGAKKIKDRVEYLMGFAATTGQVESWVFEEVGDRLIFDEEMRRRLQDNNPYAAVKIGELLVETERRGYWQADPDKLDKLRDLVLQMEGDVE